VADQYPIYLAAAVQMAPVWMDREATTQKVCDLIQTARGRGAELIVFPEVIIPGSPHWIWFEPEDYDLYTTLFKNSVEIGDATTQRLQAAARQAGAYVVIGINERCQKALYNSMLFLGPDGELLGSRRKLVGTYAEKMIWAQGEAEGLRVFPSKLGRIGGLICGENFDNLARHALAVLGEEVHAAIYLAASSRRGQLFNRWIESTAVAHALAAQCYVVCAQSCASEAEIQRFALKGPGGWSAIISPRGELVAGPLLDEEGIVVGKGDMEAAIKSYPVHDRVGYHARPDVFRFEIKRDTP